MSFNQSALGAAATAPKGTSQNEQTNHSSKPKRLKEGTKIHRVLKLLASGERLTCLMRLVHHDTCLHTTVATLERNYGLTVFREPVVRPGWGGNPTTVMEYRLTADQQEKALLLLGGS